MSLSVAILTFSDHQVEAQPHFYPPKYSNESISHTISTMVTFYPLLSILAILIQGNLPVADGSSAYLYYQNATCKSNGYIKGKIILTFDTSSMEGHGFNMTYSGKCKYIQGGSYDLLYSQQAFKMLNGYCTK